MKERLTMSNKDIDRLKVLHSVIKKQLTWNQAAVQLTLSNRQIGRLLVSVKEQGNKGIIHGLRGKQSNHRLRPGIMDTAIN